MTQRQVNSGLIEKITAARVGVLSKVLRIMAWLMSAYESENSRFVLNLFLL